MSTSLDQRIDDLLGEDQTSECPHPVILELDEHTAGVVAEGLRWALYGGTQPPGGRRSLVLVLDAIQTALSPVEVVAVDGENQW